MCSTCSIVADDSLRPSARDSTAAGSSGIGAGYQFNHWVRVDVTGEYRGKTNFRGLDLVRNGGSSSTTITTARSRSGCSSPISTSISARGGVLTPFVGAGLGVSRNTIHDFRDLSDSTVPAGAIRRRRPSKWNFAWARACRSRLRGHARLDRRTRLSLPQSRRRAER